MGNGAKDAEKHFLGQVERFVSVAQQVQRQAINGTTNVVNIANLASGVYCVSIQSEKGMATQKFIKR